MSHSPVTIPELVSSIIEHGSFGIKDLKAFSLVSRIWTGQARPRLFFTVEVGQPYRRTYNLPSFILFIAENPHIPPLVRVLISCGPVVPSDIHQIVEQLPYLQSVELEDAMFLRLQAKSCLPLYLPPSPLNIPRLRISRHFGYPRLHESAEVFANLLTAFSSVDELIMERLSLGESEDIPSQDLDPGCGRFQAVRVRDMVIFGQAGSEVVRLRGILLKLTDFTLLRSLRVREVSEFCLHEAREMIEAATGLRHLQLILVHSELVRTDLDPPPLILKSYPCLTTLLVASDASPGRRDLQRMCLRATQLFISLAATSPFATVCFDVTIVDHVLNDAWEVHWDSIGNAMRRFNNRREVKITVMGYPRSSKTV